MMNRRTWIAGITVTSLLAALLTACKQEQREQEMRQTLPVMVVSSRAVEFQESYSASIRGRQDVDIVPQVSGRITRLCVKEGEQVKTGQVLAVIDQVPYQAALRTAQANVSAAQAKVETARIELQGKQALFDEKVISDYELSLARNGLAVALAELEQAKAQETDARNNLSYTEIKSPSNGVVGTLPFRIGALVQSRHDAALHGSFRQCGNVRLFLRLRKQAASVQDTIRFHRQDDFPNAGSRPATE